MTGAPAFTSDLNYDQNSDEGDFVNYTDSIESSRGVARSGPSQSLRSGVQTRGNQLVSA
jgi:hypothetical protein